MKLQGMTIREDVAYWRRQREIRAARILLDYREHLLKQPAAVKIRHLRTRGTQSKRSQGQADALNLNQNTEKQ